MANLRISPCAKLVNDGSFQTFDSCNLKKISCMNVAPAPIFFPVGLFIVVVDISAIQHQAACYYAMRTFEIGLQLNNVFYADYFPRSKYAFVSSVITFFMGFQI